MPLHRPTSRNAEDEIRRLYLEVAQLERRANAASHTVTSSTTTQADGGSSEPYEATLSESGWVNFEGQFTFDASHDKSDWFEVAVGGDHALFPQWFIIIESMVVRSLGARLASSDTSAGWISVGQPSGPGWTADRNAYSDDIPMRLDAGDEDYYVRTDILKEPSGSAGSLIGIPQGYPLSMTPAPSPHGVSLYYKMTTDTMAAMPPGYTSRESHFRCMVRYAPLTVNPYFGGPP